MLECTSRREGNILYKQLCNLFEKAPEAFEAVAQAAGITDRFGGILKAHREVGQPFLVPAMMAVVGKITDSNAIRYNAFADEKPMRLSQHPEHIGSIQSADEEKSRFGGSVRIGPWMITFSGLPKAEQDDAVVLVAATLSGLITIEKGREIAGILNCGIYDDAMLNAA